MGEDIPNKKYDNKVGKLSRNCSSRRYSEERRKKKVLKNDWKRKDNFIKKKKIQEKSNQMDVKYESEKPSDCR